MGLAVAVKIPGTRVVGSSKVEMLRLTWIHCVELWVACVRIFVNLYWI
jgi:hypothetical protein